MYEQTHAPTDVRQHEADRVDNQIDVMTKAFFGITVGCARCHDHKFDAISTRDYYALAGFLKSSRQQVAILDPHGKIETVAKRLNELQANGTELLGAVIPQLAGAAQREFSQPLLAARENEAARPASNAAVAHADDHANTKWLVKRGTDNPFADWFLRGWAFTASFCQNAAWDSSSERPAVVVPGVLDSGVLATRLAGSAQSPTFIIPGSQVHIRVKGRGCTVRLVVDNYMVNEVHPLLFDGLIVKVDSPDEFKWVTIKGDLVKYVGERGYLSVEDDGAGEIAIDEIVFTDGPPPDDPPNTAFFAELDASGIDSLDSLAAAYGDLWIETLRQWHAGSLDRAHAELLNWMLRENLIDTSAVDAKLSELRRQMQQTDESLPLPMRVLAMADGSGQDEHLYLRGKHQNLGDVVPRRFLEALNGADQPVSGRGSGRLQLARRLVDRANPWFSRTAVNRIWYRLFGRGIVPTVDNLGAQGEPPTHPDLLDWLADEFADSGWSQKQLIRELMLSRTYQMSSRPVAATSEQRDPANMLWHRANVRRLEGEAIRDCLLAVSGRLNDTMFGPSVPAYIGPFAESNRQPATSGPLDGDRRRSIYLEVRRNFLPPMMLVFDTPTPFTAVGRRNVSNVPAQALTMLNDPLVVQLSRDWAERVMAASPHASPRQRIERMYETALCRPPSEAELNASEDFIQRQGELLGIPADERHNHVNSWADFAHVLFNHKEFVLRN
jgi:hypothetical protein